MKKTQDSTTNILLSQVKAGDSFFSKGSIIATILILLVAIVTDTITCNTFSSLLFNETPFISLFTSLVLAVGLDASLTCAALTISTPVSNDEAKRNRKITFLGLFGTFLLCYLALVLLAVAAALAVKDGSDTSTLAAYIFESGTLSRLILPLVTSFVAFFVGFTFDPNKKLI